MFDSIVADIISTQIKQSQISHCKSSCNELCAQLSKIIGSNLKFLKLWYVAEMTQLYSSCLTDFVHIKFDVSYII